MDNKRQPGESLEDHNLRMLAWYEAKHAGLGPCTFRPTIAVGVATYDCNGNPKGSGWS